MATVLKCARGKKHSFLIWVGEHDADRQPGGLDGAVLEQSCSPGCLLQSQHGPFSINTLGFLVLQEGLIWEERQAGT